VRQRVEWFLDFLIYGTERMDAGCLARRSCYIHDGCRDVVVTARQALTSEKKVTTRTRRKKTWEVSTGKKSCSVSWTNSYRLCNPTSSDIRKLMLFLTKITCTAFLCKLHPSASIHNSRLGSSADD
jgi:hypothetical protein